MKLSIAFVLTSFSLAGCATHQAPKANCFNRTPVSINATDGLAFMASDQAGNRPSSTKPDPCSFVPLNEFEGSFDG